MFRQLTLMVRHKVHQQTGQRLDGWPEIVESTMVQIATRKTRTRVKSDKLGINNSIIINHSRQQMKPVF